MARQRHRVERDGRRWRVRRDDAPARRDEHAATFRTKREALEQARRLNEYWERGSGERQ